MSRTILSRSKFALAGAVAALAIGVTAASANGLDISTSYGGGKSGNNTKAGSHGTGT